MRMHWTKCLLLVVGFVAQFLCWPGSAAANFIYWSDNGSVSHIKRANLDGSNVQTVLSGTTGRFGGVAFDVANGFLYSGDKQFLFRTNLDGSGRVNLVSTAGLGGVGDVELDLLHGKVYWNVAGGVPTLIRSANLNGSNATTLFSKGSGLFEGIALDPAAGKLYYTFSDGTINVANLDGTGSSVLKSGLPGLFDVEIDSASGKLYWNQDSTGPQGLLRRANLDGTGSIQNLLASGSNRFTNGINFDTVDQKLYYSLQNVSSGNTPLGLGRVNADGSGNQILLIDLDGINYIESLHLPPQQGPAVPEPATLTLFGVGLGAWIAHRRRRGRHL